MGLAITIISVAVSIGIFLIKVGVKVFIGIIKGLFKAEEIVSDALEARDREKHPEKYKDRGDKYTVDEETYNEIHRLIAESKAATQPDYQAELSELLMFANDIDVELLLNEMPKTIEENDLRSQARNTLTYVRKTMYELIKLRCDLLSESEKDAIWNESWQGIDSARATDAEKLNHAITYIKTCQIRLANLEKESLSSQLKSVEYERDNEYKSEVGLAR